MINLRLSITNPWSTLWDAGRAWGGMITKNLAWECQLYRSNVLLECELNITHRQDHAGIKIELGLFTWCFTANIYDTRHWNYDKGRWEIYEEL